MREILFRGKTFDNENWIEGSLIVGRDLESGELIYLISPLSAYYTEVKKVMPETVGQFTGLTDKNGTKIFEGDIVQHDFGADQIGVQYAVVEYDTKYASFMIKPIYDWMFCDKNDCEVIGNIHDNPELLKKRG